MGVFQAAKVELAELLAEADEVGSSGIVMCSHFCFGTGK